MKFSDISNEWLEIQKDEVKISSFCAYETIVKKHVDPFFDKVELSEINRKFILEFIKYKKENGRLNGRGGLSSKTVDDIMTPVNMILDYAFTMHYIQGFLLKFKIPQDTKKKEKTKVFNEKDFKKIIKYLYSNEHRNSAGLLITFNTGMRIGEITALKWGDVDLKNKCIYVSRTRQRIKLMDSKAVVIEESVKSKTSNRRIPINDTLYKFLIKYKTDDENYVLTNSTKPLEPRDIRANYTTLLKKLCIEHISFHGIRHTFATRLVNNGVNIKVVSELMGHANVGITMDLYVHTNDEDKITALNTIF